MRARRHRRTAAIKASTGLAEASLTQPGQPAARCADVRRRDDQQGRGGERRGALAGWPDVAEDADHHDRARGRRRPRRPADHHEDYAGCKLGVSGTKRLRAHRDELHDQLLVVFKILNAHHRARSELGMVDACTRAQPGRLVLFLVMEILRGDLLGVRFPILWRISARVRIGPITPVGAAAGAARRRRLVALDEIGGNLVDEARRLGILILAKHAPARRARQHQLLSRARDADVAQPPLLFELRFVFPRS